MIAKIINIYAKDKAKKGEILMKYSEDVVNRLIEEADIVDVLNYIGVSVTRGKNFRCINPDHTDRKASMGIVPNKNVCHCFACGYSANPIKLICDYHHVNFLEALEILAEIEGKPSWFEPQKKEKKGLKKPLFHLSKDELTVVGLYVQPFYHPVGFAFKPDDSKRNIKYEWVPAGYYDGDDNDYYIKHERVSCNDMMPENEVFAELVEKKCKEKMYNIIQRADLLKNIYDNEYATLYNFNKHDMETLASLGLSIAELKDNVLILMREEYEKLQAIRSKVDEYQSKLAMWKSKTPYWLRQKYA